MSDLWFTVGVPAAVGVVAAVYTTGGRSALARRAIKQDLEIANLLPAGTARAVMERVAEEKAVLYASRWVGPQTLSIRSHVILLATAGAGAVATWGAARFMNDAQEHAWLVSILVLAMLVGMGVSAVGTAMWFSLFVMADNAKARASTIDARRRRVAAYLRNR